MRFGRLVVESDVPQRARRARYVNCVCDCGGRKQICLQSLKSGFSTSCGCFAKEKIGALRRTHGLSNFGPEYDVWVALMSRCNSPQDPAYGNYGGRGIAVCKEWHEVQNFLADMGQRPTKKHSIERRDNNGPYSHDNCYWATKAEQVRNTRRNVYFEYQGKRLTMKDAAAAVGLRYCTLRYRIELGWTKERALLTPCDDRLAYRRKHPFGVT